MQTIRRLPVGITAADGEQSRFGAMLRAVLKARRHAASRDPLHPQPRAQTDMARAVPQLADTMLEQRDDAAKQVFPIGGTRVLAYPAAHYARWPTARPTTRFVYLNLRMAAGRSDAVKKRSWRRAVRRWHASTSSRSFAKRHVGITLQIDESPAGVRRQAQQPASAFQQVSDHACSPRQSSSSSPPSCTRREVARAGAPFLEAPSRDDDRRRLRDPARMGAAQARRRPRASRATRSA